jgi:uncharacterized membrane protein
MDLFYYIFVGICVLFIIRLVEPQIKEAQEESKAKGCGCIILFVIVLIFWLSFQII